MSSIDERIVEMKFLSRDFEQGIESSLKSLDQLEKGLDLENAGQGLLDLGKITSTFSLENISEGVETVASKFNALGAIGFSVLDNLTDTVLGFANQKIGDFLEPVITGGRNRAQSIAQAKFQFKGLGLDVEKVMEQALYAVKGTAFGLDEAAKAAANLGASRVPIDQMGVSLRAISGVAALSGSSYTDVADVFTKVAGQGRLMGDDLNRLAARGVNAAAQLAKAMGITEGEVREMVSEGKVSFADFSKYMDDAFGEHATKASETYTGSLSNMNAALARIGAAYYTPELERQRKLYNAMTPVIDKLAAALTPLLNLITKIKDSSNDQLIGFIENIDTTAISKYILYITDIINILYNAIQTYFPPIQEAFLEVFPPSGVDIILEVLKAIQSFAGGLALTANGADRVKGIFKGFFTTISIGMQIVAGIFDVIMRVVGALSSAIAPLFDLGEAVGEPKEAFEEFLSVGDKIKVFFTTLGDILVKPAAAFGTLVTWLAELVRGFNDAQASSIGNDLTLLEKIGKGVATAWGAVVKAFTAVVEFFKPMATEIGNFFRDVGPGIEDAFSNINWDMLTNVLDTGIFAALVLFIKNFFKSITGTVTGEGPGLVEQIKEIIGGVTDTFDQMQNTLKAGSLVAIAVAIGILAAALFTIAQIDPAKLNQSLLAIGILFGQMIATLMIFEKTLAAGDFAKIGVVSFALILLSVAVAILAKAVSELAKNDWNELAKGLTGVAVLMGTMAGMAKLLQGNTGGLIAAGIAMTIMGAGLLIFAQAVKQFAGLEWEELGKGIGSVAAIMLAVGLFNKAAAANKGAFASAAGLLILGIALNVFASSISKFAEMNTGSLTQGLLALGAVLVMMNYFTKQGAASAGIIKSAVSLVILGGALNIMAMALERFASLSPEQMVVGLVAMAGTLLLVVVAMNALPGGPQLLITAAALVIVGAALVLIGDAFKTMGSMSWDEIGRGFVVLAGSLILLAAAMYAMSAGLPGAAALLVAAAALSVLAPVMIQLGTMSWDDIGRGLTVLAGALAIIALAGVALAPAAVVFLAFAIAAGILAGAIFLASIGITAFAVGLAALGTAGALGAAGIAAALTAIIALIPLAMTKLAEGIVAFGTVIAEAGTVILDVFVTILTSLIEAVATVAPLIVTTLVDILTLLIDAIVEMAPKIIDAAVVLITSLISALEEIIPQIIDLGVTIVLAFAEAIVELVPKLVDAGMRLIVGILNGIADNIGKMVEAGADIIVNFLNGIANSLPRIIQAGINLIISFVEGLAQGIRNNTARMNAAGADLADAIIQGMVGGIAGGIGSVISAAQNMAQQALNAARNLLGIESPSKEFHKVGMYSTEGAAGGFDDGTPMVVKSVERMGDAALTTMERAMASVSDAVDISLDMDPQIRPVIDLSDVEAKSARIEELLFPPTLDVSDSYEAAAEVDFEVYANVSGMGTEDDDDEGTEGGTPPSLSFVQNNYSPKALSLSETYRQTKNQFSQAKDLLKKP
jgi:tape measure domain-containing protein